MTGLGRLICGNTQVPCVADAALDNICETIDRFANRAVSYLDGEFTEEAQIFGAFCARVILENACAALVGRLDPFRLLYLAEFQSQGGFEYGRSAKSGFKWAGDVLSDEKPIQSLWSSDHDLSRISRALFSPHVDHVFWKPAVEKTLDYVAANSINLQDLNDLDPDTFTSEAKGRCATLYSTLSKGVHWEFFVSNIAMDESTVRDAIRQCLNYMSRIALISHFVPTVYRRLEPNIALENYSVIKMAMR